MKPLLKIVSIILIIFIAIFLYIELIGIRHVDAIENRQIVVVNKSNEVIYCFLSDFGKFDKNVNSNIIDSINPNLRDSIYCTDNSWDSFQIRSGNKICIFIISSDSVTKYSLDSVLVKQIYTKKILVDIDYLDKNNWIINYN